MISTERNLTKSAFYRCHWCNFLFAFVAFIFLGLSNRKLLEKFIVILLVLLFSFLFFLLLNLFVFVLFLCLFKLIFLLNYFFNLLLFWFLLFFLTLWLWGINKTLKSTSSNIFELIWFQFFFQQFLILLLFFL